jgi:nucleotide-binding universal stress UspA family protein
VPCNLERYGDEALVYAVSLADALKAEVCALLVGPPGGWKIDADAALKRHLDHVLGARARSVARVLRFGDAREQIALEAQTGRYGLLALSAHHRTQLSDLALGTTAERLLRQCPMPLLAVPATARPAAARGVTATTARR